MNVKEMSLSLGDSQDNLDHCAAARAKDQHGDLD